MLLFSIMVLTACAETTNHNYKFTGEGEHWEAEYSYEGIEIWGEDGGTRTYSNEDSYEFVLKYKGSLEELSSMKKLEYAYETTAKGGSKTETFTDPPTEVIFTTGGSSKGGAKVSEDSIIQIDVKWDDFEESFELHNKSK